MASAIRPTFPGVRSNRSSAGSIRPRREIVLIDAGERVREPFRGPVRGAGKAQLEKTRRGSPFRHTSITSQLQALFVDGARLAQQNGYLDRGAHSVTCGRKWLKGGDRSQRARNVGHDLTCHSVRRSSDWRYGGVCGSAPWPTAPGVAQVAMQQRTLCGPAYPTTHEGRFPSSRVSLFRQGQHGSGG